MQPRRLVLQIRNLLAEHLVQRRSAERSLDLVRERRHLEVVPARPRTATVQAFIEAVAELRPVRKRAT